MTIDMFGELTQHDIDQPTNEMLDTSFDKGGTIVRFHEGRFQYAGSHKWTAIGNWDTTSPWQITWHDIEARKTDR
jgi:hypothetical protein